MNDLLPTDICRGCQQPRSAHDLHGAFSWGLWCPGSSVCVHARHDFTPAPTDAPGAESQPGEAA